MTTTKTKTSSRWFLEVLEEIRFIEWNGVEKVWSPGDRFEIDSREAAVWRESRAVAPYGNSYTNAPKISTSQGRLIEVITERTTTVSETTTERIID